MKIVKGMVAVITGGGGGIAKCVAQELAVKGCNLALVDINLDALEANKKALAEYSVDISLHVADITSFEAVSAMAYEVLAHHKKVNILDNNAGITIQKSFENHSLADWDRMIGINLMGVIYGCKAFLPALKESAKTEGAHIVNMSSLAGLSGLPSQASYSLTKSAVRTLSETLYSELHHQNIGVTAVHPGGIKTKMILATLDESDDVEVAEKNYKMVEKMGNTPEYAAKIIVHAIEKDKVRIIIGNDSRAVDILKRLFPNWFVKRFAKLAAKQNVSKPVA